MKRTLIATVLASAIVTPVFAQTAPDAEATPPAPLTANVGLFSSYRFRGIDQTYGKPALQGGFDYVHSSGLYVGNWNSNVQSGAGYPDGNLEMDFYGGYKSSFGDFGIDVGALYYYYPGSQARGLTGGRTTGPVDNKELYIAGSWKTVSLKWSYAIDDYFSTRGVNSSGALNNQRTRGSNYLDLTATYDLGEGWGLVGHVGHLDYKNVHNGSYTDWKLGVTKDFSGWVVGLSYIDTNSKGQCSGATTYQPYCFANSASDNGTGGLNTGSKFKDAGSGTAMLSISRTF